MMKLEILEDFPPVSNDQSIVKGKRTKRPRPSSSASSSGAAAAAASESHNSLVYSSPTTSSRISSSTEEDKDMANCLILLARGSSPLQAATSPENKFSSRKFTEMATTTAGKVGIYVYECKTCNRSFPSFQALGGHRASHKKPKPTIENDQEKSPPPQAAVPDVQEIEGKQFCKLNTHSSLLPDKSCQINDQTKPKIHECSICGSEFASGQALGGHMRRHRASPSIASTRISGAASINNDTSSHHDIGEKRRNILALDLDLNLPAPPEDDIFNQFSPKQQPRIVFSSAALVDCHY